MSKGKDFKHLPRDANLNKENLMPLVQRCFLLYFRLVRIRVCFQITVKASNDQQVRAQSAKECESETRERGKTQVRALIDESLKPPQ